MKQALCVAREICHRQQNEKQLGSAVTGTLLGIAKNAAVPREPVETVYSEKEIVRA